MEPVRVLNLNVANFRNGGRSKIVYNWGMMMDKNRVIYDYFASDQNVENIDEYLREIKLRKGIFYNDIINESNNILYKQVAFAKSLNRVFKRNDYKIVNIHSSWAFEALRGVLVCKFNKIPTIIVHSHNTGLDKGGFFKLKYITHNVCKFLLNLFKIEHFACSKLASEWMFGKNQKNVRIINNGIDIKKFVFSESIRREFRSKYKLQDKFIIGHIGRFTYQKNHSFIVDIFNEIYKENPKSILILIGEGALKEKVQNKVNELCLHDNVVFLGNRNDIPEWLSAMDIFVLPSIYEGLGIVNIEAQASGLPTIVSEAIPTEAKVTSLLHSLPLESGAKVWADFILSNFNNYRRKDMHNEIVNAEYDIHDVVQKLQEIYLDKGLLGGDKERI